MGMFNLASVYQLLSLDSSNNFLFWLEKNKIYLNEKGRMIFELSTVFLDLAVCIYSSIQYTNTLDNAIKESENPIQSDSEE